MEVDRKMSIKDKNCEVGFFRTSDGLMVIRKSNLQNKLAINEEDPRVCRACLSADKLRPWTKHIAKVFSQFTASPDVFGDAYPQYLCSICLALIKKFFHFRNRCERSKEVFEKLNLWGRWSVDTIKKERRCRYSLNLSAIENTSYQQKLNRAYTRTLHIDIPPNTSKEKPDMTVTTGPKQRDYKVVRSGSDRQVMVVRTGQDKPNMIVTSEPDQQDVIVTEGPDKQEMIVTSGPSIHDMKAAIRQESNHNRLIYQHNSDMILLPRPDIDEEDASNEHVYHMFPNYTESEEEYTHTQHNEEIMYQFDSPPNNVSRAKEKKVKKKITRTKKRLLQIRKKELEMKQKEGEAQKKMLRKRQMERKRNIQRRIKLEERDDSETLTASSNCDEPETKATSNHKQADEEPSSKMNIDETAHSHQTQPVFRSKRLNEKLKAKNFNRSDEYFYGDLWKQRRKLKSIRKGQKNIPKQQKEKTTVIVKIPDENVALFDDLVKESKPDVDRGLLDLIEDNDENNDEFEDIKPDIEELIVRSNKTHLEERPTQPAQNKSNLPRNGMLKRKKLIHKTKGQLLYMRKRKWEKRQKEIEAEKQREMLRKEEIERRQDIQKSKKLLDRDDSDTLTASSNCDDDPDEEAPTNEETDEETPIKMTTELNDHLYCKPPVLQRVRERHKHSDEKDRNTAIVQIPDENVSLDDSDDKALSDYLSEDIDQNPFEDLKPDIEHLFIG